MTILDRLADHARRRTEQAKRKTPLAALERQALSMPKGAFAFEAALKKPGLSFICECKKASPSKGMIALEFPYRQIALDYEAAGAAAVPAAVPVRQSWSWIAATCTTALSIWKAA